MPKPSCRALPRPTHDDDPDRDLVLVQGWRTPGAGDAELFLESHEDHLHAWWRWGCSWSVSMDHPDDWTYYQANVQPIIRDLVAVVAARTDLFVESESAELLAPRSGSVTTTPAVAFDDAGLPRAAACKKITDEAAMWPRRAARDAGR